MTKTLHLYEPHFISLVDECLASEHRLMATAVLEPYMGEAESDAGPGSFVGGYNFSLSCGCLVQVLSAKPYTGGYLVRIRGEARLGISGLPQTGPYMRAQVYPLPDQAAASVPEQETGLRAKVAELQEIMRDVQNLASKFRCDETAALQQAMRWLYADPITPGVQRVVTAQVPIHGSAPAGDVPLSGHEGQGREGSSGPQQQPSVSGSGQRPGESRATGAEVPSQAAENASGAPELAASLGRERMHMVRCRLLAMDTRDTGRRLDLALEAMGGARASLAAKCAIKSV
ncbi:hypothetical protein GPECTOR_4g1010 [Gonium pectorale]|uniref:Lon N-terminal domain-containing protein n=1 Tax=Gonium pectorale TaxID=33097 RepID=A0A150GXB3_GONPE|nr:hypothetical protein GPECTOR_4g1010 [Gonium pectorale]|eukprot:KXZ54459.1 hypothetical protein GPECTOR_4g1010 [Gonium pectorale]